jgi:putative membrane protein
MNTNVLNRWILGAGISLTVTVTAFAADTVTIKNDTTTAETTGSISAQQFVSQAVWGSDKEIALGRLAQQRSQNPEVKSFASRMVADHSRAADRLTTIADREHLYYPSANAFTFVTSGTTVSTTERTTERNITPGGSNPSLDNPKGLPAKALMENSWSSRTNTDLTTVRSLSSLSGPEFDRAYIDEMVKDHQQDMQEFQNASASLDDQQLKQCATDLLPTIQEHYRMAQDLQSKLGGPGTTSPSSRPPSGY